MKAINNIREFVWPLIEKSNDKVIKQYSLIENISDKNLQEVVLYKTKMFEAEEDRRKSIESKAALFISTSSVATSLIVAANTLISGKTEFNWMIKLTVITAFVLTIYTVRTIWFSIKVLERQKFSVPSSDNIEFSGNKKQYFRSRIKELNRINDVNANVINLKVDYLTLAQEYFKRAMILICIYAFLLLIYSLVK